MKEFRSGHVSIIGKPNVGKSTLLNQLIDQKISIVSRKPQTTRWNINGIKTSSNYQIIFIDTPGLQINPKFTLNRYMNKEVSNSLIFVDIILFVVEALNWNELDVNVVKLLKNTKKTKLFLVLNKIDKIPKKDQLLSDINAISKEIEFDEIIPVSAIKDTGINRLEGLIAKSLPVSQPFYPIEQITDRSERFFACIWVEKQGQKKIVIGKNGKVLKEIGRLARLELENLYDKKVNLKTWVKVKSKWSDSKTALKKFGF